jgi:hypothetical protein
MLPFLVPVLFTFYIQGVLILNKNSGAKGLRWGWVWIPDGLILRGENRGIRGKKTSPIATLSFINHTRIGPGTKPGFHEERTAPKPSRPKYMKLLLP